MSHSSLDHQIVVHSLSPSPSSSSPSPLTCTRPRPEYTPSSTNTDTPLSQSSDHDSASSIPANPSPALMDASATAVVAPVDREETNAEQSLTKSDTALDTATGPEVDSAQSQKKTDERKHGKKQHKKKRSKRSTNKSDSSSSSSSDSLDDESDSSSSSSSDSESEDLKKKAKEKKKKKRALRAKKKKKAKANKKHTTKGSDDLSDSSDLDSSGSSSDSDSSQDEKKKRKLRKKAKKAKKLLKRLEESDSEDDSDVEDPLAPTDDNALLHQQLANLKLRRPTRGIGSGLHRLPPPDVGRYRGLGDLGLDPLAGLGKAGSKKKKKKGKRASTLEYKRVDQLWDSSIHNYKLTESVEDKEDEFDQYVFTVRRRFDWENKYKNTVVDIKSKLLRDALQEVMKDVKGVSLVEDQPIVDPNMLFLYLEELREHAKKTLKARAKTEKKRKAQKKINLMRSHCKVMIKYLDKDYDETKKTLYPMLEAGNITFDLLWALFKPNMIAFTTTYGSVDDPRCFKVDYANKESSFMRGEWYSIEGRYLEYDGKAWGLGEFDVEVESFKGPRKITSLATYPLKYHKDPEGLTKQLIERGKKLVELEGMNYRFHKGLAFMKKKKAVAKVNINGRIMIDPAIFRRINPNYPISVIKPREGDDHNDSSDEKDCSSCGSDSEGGLLTNQAFDKIGEERERTKFVFIRDKNDRMQIIEVPVDERGRELRPESIDKLPEGTDPSAKREFSEEDLLIASPVVLGFAYSEKLWLEFSLSGVRDIEWNEGAFDSLVLPANQKSIVKALVESHKFHPAKTIDDVVQGKGKGLVAVLHGPPGTGKTLTAEGIAEVLKSPLYMVSAGELGTDPRSLEHELQKILDIAHSWGAVLLLDEADVFLEKREVHDIHRNALVSIFLRLLEYFQGILFLTTNRVETFDDAFQSRIHIALRYGELTVKARRAVWVMFLEKVQAMENVDSIAWTDADYDALARHSLNGRQIKNATRTAQALAVNEKQRLSMEHIKRVLDVAENFEKDLKGGRGYEDAMRSYT